MIRETLKTSSRLKIKCFLLLGVNDSEILGFLLCLKVSFFKSLCQNPWKKSFNYGFFSQSGSNCAARQWEHSVFWCCSWWNLQFFGGHQMSDFLNTRPPLLLWFHSHTLTSLPGFKSSSNPLMQPLKSTSYNSVEQFCKIKKKKKEPFKDTCLSGKRCFREDERVWIRGLWFLTVCVCVCVMKQLDYNDAIRKQLNLVCFWKNIHGWITLIFEASKWIIRLRTLTYFHVPGSHNACEHSRWSFCGSDRLLGCFQTWFWMIRSQVDRL